MCHISAYSTRVALKKCKENKKKGRKTREEKNRKKRKTAKRRRISIELDRKDL